MNKSDRIYIAGHRGLVGSALVRHLEGAGFTGLITRTSAEVDLRNQAQVEAFFGDARPKYVFLAAAKVGGIHANATYPAEFIRDNLQIQTNVIEAARLHGATKLQFLGSSCIYPKLVPQPMAESCLLAGPLEPTNEWYAIAKIAGLKMCQAYRRQYGFNAIGVMPTNLYGPGDNFSLENSHVLPAMIRKFHEAKEKGAPSVLLWGTGTPRREFLHVDDLAAACVYLMQHYESEELVNIGCGEDVSIAELATIVSEVVRYKGGTKYDTTKPDGPPRKLLNVSRLKALGWSPTIALREGVSSTYEWFLQNHDSVRS